MWRRYWAAVASISAVVTIVVAAAQFHLLWVALAVLIVGAPIAGLPRAVRWARSVLRRYRDHPLLAQQVASLEGKVSALEGAKVTADQDRDNAVAAALKEGQNQAIGAVLGTIADVPVIVSVTTKSDQLVVCGRVAEEQTVPHRRARFALVPEGQEENILGVLEVTKVKDQFVWMAPAMQHKTVYIDRLQARAATESSPPTAATLIPVHLPTED